MSDYLPIRILHDFTERLELLGINYMLTGSMAMIRYTVFRQTADIDVIVEIRRNDISSFVKEFENDYYIPTNSMSRAVNDHGMFNVIHTASAFKVDCIVKKDNEFQQSCFDRRQRTDYFGREIWVATCEDLIISKLLWSKDTRSEMQFRDIRNLLATDFDTNYVAGWANRLGVGDNYQYLLSEVSK